MFYKLSLVVLVMATFCRAVENNQFSMADIMAIDSSRVLTSALIFLSEPPVTVTSAYCERSAGGIHDYYSEGDYWWPDPENLDGPFIRKDGMTNPNNFTAHRMAMRRLSIIVPTLVAAFKLTGDQRYADTAINHLMSWFVNEGTRMNPDLLYAQAIKGRVTGRGIGIIDTIHLVEVVQAIICLEKLNYINPGYLKAIKQWFAEYLEWITAHPYGHEERDNGNNHSTCWAMQVAAYARLTHNREKIDFVRTMYKEVLIPEQMAADGSFPKELSRTKPYGYMLFNLDAMAMVCLLASENNDLWFFNTADGRGMQKAMDFMFPYIKDKALWPYSKDVMYFDQWPVRQPSLLFAGIVFNRMDYIELWKTLNPDPSVDEIVRNFFIRQPVLWF